MPTTSIVFPESLQWFGIGRETTAGTIVPPTVTIPVEKGEPDEKPTWLDDKSLRASMATEFALIQGVECADFSLNGPVYIDTIGHMLFNILGDYTSAGTASTPTWTATGGVTAGSTSITVTTGSVAVQGTAIQVGSTSPTETVLVGAGSTSTSIVLATPARFTHTGSTTITTVVAPFTHTFSLLNTAPYGQPVTHTITHHQGISGTYGARQYAYWCASELEFTMNAEQLFMSSVKGTSYLGQAAASSPTNTLSTAAAQANWQLLAGLGGPATGGTLISDVMDATLTIGRAVKPLFTLDGSQTPYIIARNGLEISGKLTQLAQDESPMLDMLNNVQPQLQLVMSNGKTGASLLSVTFNLQVAAYDTVKLNAADEIQYDVTFKAIANSTNAGASGGLSPGSIIVQNAIPTY